MQVINYLPIAEQLALERFTAQCVVDLLVEPFGTASAARIFWREYSSVIICFNRQDDLPAALNIFDDVTRQFIEEAELNPEFVENLADGYQLSLTITNDMGTGLYLIKPKELIIYQGDADE
ncbi:MAG: hypothetical protein HRT52_11710 [Colwellia sp.]|nr:hypothetical protein [Colwellia sp.]NQZ81672.1 hypothetical protein [Colwellia sp.]